MGFLKNFSEPFAFAMALWPFVSMLLTVPVLALLYHRDNRIRLSSAIVAYGTVLYCSVCCVSHCIRCRPMRRPIAPRTI